MGQRDNNRITLPEDLKNTLMGIVRDNKNAALGAGISAAVGAAFGGPIGAGVGGAIGGYIGSLFSGENEVEEGERTK